MGSNLFIISTLALLAASDAQYCQTATYGDLSGTAVRLEPLPVPTGTYNIYIPPHACQDARYDQHIGTLIQACADAAPAPTDEMLDLDTGAVNSNYYPATVYSTVYCQNTYGQGPVMQAHDLRPILMGGVPARGLHHRA